MGIENTTELLYALLASTKPSELQSILLEIGDHRDIGVDKQFGQFGFQWHFFGDNPSNMSTINLGSKPGRSLTERVTNAIDAVLEREMYRRNGVTAPPQSPMEAAELWLGRPRTTANTGLFGLDPDLSAVYSKDTHVVLSPGDESTNPTVDIMDAGIGIKPEDFTETILNFHRGNKINKRYLAGAFGQGGSATIAFSDYTLAISRHFDSEDVVGFTIVKLMELEDEFKENAYVYLAAKNNDGSFTIPCCKIPGPIDIYPFAKDSSKKPPRLASGTVVRHFGYRLDGLERPLSPSPRNLYHLFQYMLFDPLLPFRVVDLRNTNTYKNELVTGSRNRLMSGSDDFEIRHHQPRFWIRPLNDEEPSLGVEYWVVFAQKQPGGKISPRSRPHDLFLDPAHPLIGTLNGQNHGELTARIVREANLSQVAKHLVVHLDLSYVSKRVRSRLLSSTREGFKDGEVLTEVVRLLKEHFRDDEALFEIESELEETLMQNESQKASQEVRRHISHLLRDIGLDFTGYSGAIMPGENTTRKSSSIRSTRTTRKVELIPTLPYPGVSKIKIVRPEMILRIHQGDSRFVKVQTDADSLFDKEKRLTIHSEPTNLVDVSKGTLIGGRINWRLRPRPTSRVGDTGDVVVRLSLPEGGYLEDRLPYEVLPPREQRIRTTRGVVPRFDIQGLDPYENVDQFFRVWDSLDPEEDDLTSVAYKLIETSSGLIIYYSKVFSSYRKMIDAVMQRKPGLARQVIQNYEVWIGYYAILQWQQRSLTNELPGMEIDDDVMERVQDNERALVAEMQVKQALEVAQLQEYAKIIVD